MKTGIIQQSLSGFYDVIADEKIYRTRARGNFRQRKIKPVVGDHVEFSAENQQEGYLKTDLLTDEEYQQLLPTI